jgi:PhoH-like ATPase
VAPRPASKRPAPGHERHSGHRLLKPKPNGNSQPHFPIGRSLLPPLRDDVLVFRKPLPPLPKRTAELLSSIRRKLFVLDTNVLIHDPTALFRFADNDVFIPLMTLEELDGHKKGTSEVARNAREVSRLLDALIGHSQEPLEKGLPLSALGHTDAVGRLFLQTKTYETVLPTALPPGKGDNQILGVVRGLAQEHPDGHIILVTKDINMRVKARALGILSEDYKSDRTLEDTDLLYTGVAVLPADVWARSGDRLETSKEGGATIHRFPRLKSLDGLVVNQFVYDEGTKPPFYAIVHDQSPRGTVLRSIRNYGREQRKIFGIMARNREQNFALNLLLDPEIDFVTLIGQAGTGKTLLTLAAALHQVLESKRYTEIIVTRATVPVGEDIGFLPGTEEEKMTPWMGALEDNLEVLGVYGATKHDGAEASDWHRQTTSALLRQRLRIKSMNFMRGRTFLQKFLIIDEAQNLTPKQMKTLVTRAGPGTKVVCLGNLGQIDTPYLTEGSSGLTYVVDHMKGWKHAGHVMLSRGERSRLADHATQVL